MDGDLEGRTFVIDAKLSRQFHHQLGLDSTFLASANLMDYSLLLGVASGGPLGASDDKASLASSSALAPPPYGHQALPTGLLPSVKDPEVYVVGIIDYLQDYNAKKKAAHAMKSIVHKQVRHPFNSTSSTNSTLPTTNSSASAFQEELSTVKPMFYAWRFQCFLAEVILSKP